MAGKEFLIENANIARKYVTDWVGGGDISSADQIPAGQGAVLRTPMRRALADPPGG